MFDLDYSCIEKTDIAGITKAIMDRANFYKEDNLRKFYRVVEVSRELSNIIETLAMSTIKKDTEAVLKFLNSVYTFVGKPQPIKGNFLDKII